MSLFLQLCIHAIVLPVIAYELLQGDQMINLTDQSSTSGVASIRIQVSRIVSGIVH